MHSSQSNTIRKLGITFIGLLLAWPAMAHVKWFVDPNMAPPANFTPYSFTDPAVLIWIVIALCIISGSIIIDMALPKMNVPSRAARQDVMEILRTVTGISLLIGAYEGNVIAPHMQGYGWFGSTLVMMQAAVGVMFMSLRLLHHACMLLFLLMIGLMIQFGVTSLIEYSNMIGIGLFFFINTLPTEELRKKYQPYSVDLLRIFTGIALLYLGITEKLSGAVLGQAFLTAHPWNFMPELGLDWFTNELFVLSAGVMEVVFGAILILGSTTRINVIVVSVFMLASNLVFVFIGDQSAATMELIGHMPVIGSALVLIVMGYGQKWKVTNLWQKNEKAEFRKSKLELDGVN